MGHLTLTPKGKEWIRKMKEKHPEEMKALKERMGKALDKIPIGDEEKLIDECYKAEANRGSVERK